MSESDERRSAWGVLLAVVAVAVGIVTISVVGPKLPHQSEADIGVTTSTTAPSTTASPYVTLLSAFEPAPGWEDLGFLPEPHYFAITANTGTELLVFGGGSSPAAVNTQWSGVAIDLATSAMDELPPSPLCKEGTPTGAWAGEGLVVWSATTIPDRCPAAAVYTPASNSWRVLDSGFFRKAGANVVWTGEELVSAKGLAYRPDTGETRDLPAIDSLPTFVNQRYATVWTGTDILAVSSEGMVRLDPSTDTLTDLPPPTFTADLPFVLPIADAVWIGSKLLAVGPSDFLLFDPATNEWQSLPSLTGCSPAISSGGGLAFVNLCDAIAVWDGSGSWKFVPSAGFYNVPIGEPGKVVDAGGYLYQIAGRVLRYPLPDLVDGALPQPALIPFASQYLELMPSWQVVDSFTVDRVASASTFGLDIAGPDLGVGCSIEATPWRSNDPYIPLFTDAARLTRDQDQVEIPIGVGWDDQGFAHVVINAGRTIDDVRCRDMAASRTVAARLWSPGTPPSAYPPGTDRDTTCYVALSSRSEPKADATEIIVQVAFAARQSCAVQGPLALSFWFPPVFVDGNPVTVDLGQTLSAEQPYLIARYTLTNWCSDGPANVHAAVAYRFTLDTDVTASCLDAEQRPSIELASFEGPTATPALP